MNIIAQCTYKPWLDGRLFAAILGGCGRPQSWRSGAIGGDFRRDANTILTNGKGTRSPGDWFNILNKLPTIAGDYASSKVKPFITPLFYTTNDVRLTYFCLLGSPAVADVVLRCRESPSVADKNRPCNQTYIFRWEQPGPIRLGVNIAHAYMVTELLS